MLCFFKLTLCPLPTTTRYSSHAHCIALFYIYTFHSARSFTKFSPLHAVCVPCPQPSPARASTGDRPPPAPVMDVLVTSIDRACVESATDVLGARPRARSVELRTALNGAVCALSTRRNLSVDSAPRWTDPTRAGTLLDALELACLWAKAVLSWHRSSAPLSSTPRSPPRRQSSRAGRAPGHHFTKEGQQPLP